MSYLVSLDDCALTDVTHLVRVVDVIELQPGRTTTAKERLCGPGSFVVRDHINTKQVRVQFALLTSDPVKRSAALSAITAWAMNGKWLRIGDRPGQQLRVICTDTPLTMSKRKWTELCEMTFTAFVIPHWEDVLPTMETAQLQSGEISIIAPGNVQHTPLRFTVTPTEGKLTSLTVAANGAELAFSRLAIPAGDSIQVDYTEGILTAKWIASDGAETPCLQYRTGAEFLPLLAGRTNAVRVTADVNCSVTLAAKGWYW